MSVKRKKTLAIDLDGVIIDKPPFVPKKLLELLYRGVAKKKLSYRYPKTCLERYIRWLSHYPLFRPPIDANIKKILEAKKNKNLKLYAISSRYSFLHGRTQKWFKFYNLESLFDKVFLNDKDEQPHKFKEKILRRIKTQIFIDDDIKIVKFLKSKKLNTQVYYIEVGLKKLEDR